MKPEVQRRKFLESVEFEQNGFQVLKSLVEPSECNLLSAELTPLFDQQSKNSKSKIGGVRNLLRNNPKVCQIAKSTQILSTLEKFAGSSCFPIRAIFFDKNLNANWLVPWHQDLSIAVVERIESPGFSGWSVKDEVLHVHPPCEVLENMITVRIHLDDCDAGNGALKVIAGSHLAGKLAATDVSKWTTTSPSLVCELAKGDVLLMRPLLLHSSSPAINPLHRRVLHLEYATRELPNGLKWLHC